MSGQPIGERLNFTDYLDSTVTNTEWSNGRELAMFLSNAGLTLSVMESVTGGGVARQLVEHPGASAYFLGGVVAYNTRLKLQYAGVSPRLIAQHGEVSPEVTTAMAQGIRTQTKSDIGIATNGIAGPANQQFSDDQSGTVFLSWNIRDTLVKTKRFKIDGSRKNVINTTVSIALFLCLNYVKQYFNRKD
jgi:nicotinamide-nucleotide amidase